MRKKPYQEGDWFAVPIQRGYVLGKIARVGRRGGIILGYFFKPSFELLPTVENTVGLNAGNAFYINMFCDPALMSGEWPVVYRPHVWNKDEWPNPSFRSIGMQVPNLIECVQYNEQDLAIEEYREFVPLTIAKDFPMDGLSGHLNLQENLERYVNRSSAEQD